MSPNTVIISEIHHKNVVSIIINKEDIFINETCFNQKNLKRYDSSIKFQESEPKKIISRIEKNIKENISKFNPLSLGFLIEEEFEENFKTRFQIAFVKHIKSAWKDIIRGDLIRGVSKLKGSGMGLTPGGDDFICGMLYALVLYENLNKKDTTKVRELIYKAAISNNHISRNMLYHASIGAYFKQFKDLQKAFITNDIRIKDYLINLIEIGETSGSDILTGYFLCLKYLNKII